MTILKKLGTKVKNQRNKIEITQADLADSIGVHSRYIQKIEAGEANISHIMLYKLAKALRVQPSELVD